MPENQPQPGRPRTVVRAIAVVDSVPAAVTSKAADRTVRASRVPTGAFPSSRISSRSRPKQLVAKAKEAGITGAARFGRPRLISELLAKQNEGLDQASGILEVRPDGYGFLRTNGYLPGANDVYVVAVADPAPRRLRTGDLSRRSRASAEALVRELRGAAAGREGQRHERRKRSRRASVRCSTSCRRRRRTSGCVSSGTRPSRSDASSTCSRRSARASAA